MVITATRCSGVIRISSALTVPLGVSYLAFGAGCCCRFDPITFHLKTLRADPLTMCLAVHACKQVVCVTA